MADIVFDNVTKRYPDGYEAVKSMNLEIKDGEFMILVGPSGCGKSTALNMIAGLEDISDGQLRIGGEVVNDKPPRDRDIAMVFQSYALYPHMSVRANMAFPLTIVKTPKEEVKQRVEEAAKILDLEQHLDRKPSQLSGGQRQRVAMGRAIVRNPKAFLMDEPLSNLDAKLRVQMRTSVARLQDQLGTTMVYVTHDQTEAMTLGDRVAIMRAGVLQQVGSPMELYNEPNNLFVAGFIGSPAMNFLPATLEGDAIKLPMVDVRLPEARREALGRLPKDKPLIAGIRPEDFEDAVVIGNGSKGATFKARIDVLEAMGSEFYAHFTIDAQKGEMAQSEELRELREDAGGDTPGEGFDIVARLDQTSGARAKNETEIWINTDKIQLFDPETGKNLAGA
ncbi:MAG TPA: sn-glycerol-3-phosphate ABC transporter ATP-binding protein UgpC [Solirubrobacter sp.]|nr:sn-glycerol-3-phosphate ABC transporter ATP-binding protein UgpC [Solirubrobacter sp.]